MSQSPQHEQHHSSQEPDEDESDTMDEFCSDQCSSGDDEYDSDDSEMCQDIVNDVRDLAKREKIEVLIEVIKSRTEQLRLHRQLEVYQYAMDVLGGEKMKLQLDLALTTKMLVVLKEALTEQRKQDEKVLARINMTSDFIGDLDMKRVQLIKEIRHLTGQFAEHKSKAEETVNERVQDEINRSRQLQDQLDAVYVTNNEMKQQLTEVEEARQTLASTLSERLNEMAKLTDELQEARNRIELEMQTKAKLTEKVEMLLTEKTQLATEVIAMENRFVELEQANEAKLAQMEQTANSRLLELEQLKDAKLAELEQAWKSTYEEEMKKVNAKLTEAKVRTDEIEKQNTTLQITIEKLRADLESCVKQLEKEKDRAKQFESEIGGLKTLLEDRNNEISLLNGKLNGEQQRVNEEMEKIEDINNRLKNLQVDTDKKVSDLENQLKEAQKEAAEFKTKNEQLEIDMRNQVAKISVMELTISEKDKEQIALQEKLTAAEKSENELEQLRSRFVEQKSMIQSLEEQLKAKLQEDIRTNVENFNNQSTAQITSTPLRQSNLPDSMDAPLSKRMRMVDSDVMSVHSSVSNYASFQGNVDRKRDTNRFFNRRSPVQAKKKSESRSFFARSAKQNIDDELISLASTINLDEEPLETANLSMSDSPVPLVKPFFRRQSDKK